jgi:hypothetical protein
MHRGVLGRYARDGRIQRRQRSFCSPRAARQASRRSPFSCSLRSRFCFSSIPDVHAQRRRVRFRRADGRRGRTDHLRRAGSAGDLRGPRALSLGLYILTAFNKQSGKSAEAAIKYYLFGAMSAAFLLFGFSYLYGLSGSTSLPKIVLGTYLASATAARRCSSLRWS